MDHETALKIGNAFGGGMGKTGETCGAVTGALMVISLKYGATDTNNKESREKTYDLAGRFIEIFKSRNRSVSCRELLGFDMASDNRAHAEIIEIILEKCPKYVKDAAEIIEDMLRR